MNRRQWTEAELQFLRDHYPEHTAYWCAKQLGRSRGSVWLKLRNGLRSKSEDPDLGPAKPPLANRCVGCNRVSSTRRCPVCQEKHLARYGGSCWGPTYDEAYGVARSL